MGLAGRPPLFNRETQSFADCAFGICWRRRASASCLDAINRCLERAGRMMRGGSIADAALSCAPGSAKNAEKNGTRKCTRRRGETNGILV
jgi:hypothetical protein